jgi:uncharacterized protein
LAKGERVAAADIQLRVAEPLRFFLRGGRRAGEVRVRHDGTSSLGHVVQSIGIPLSEVGQLLLAGAAVPSGHRPRNGDLVKVQAIERPQPLPPGPARFVLDVHLGTLSRRMRLLGLDTRYATEATDDDLVELADAEDRVLLTKDRGLLCRRVPRHAAYVRGSSADQQIADVLDRFAPTLAPFTRCTSCNGRFRAVPKAEIRDGLKPGTARSYEEFAQCLACDQVYWRGAHARQLDALVSAAEAAGNPE